MPNFHGVLEENQYWEQLGVIFTADSLHGSAVLCSLCALCVSTFVELLFRVGWWWVDHGWMPGTHQNCSVRSSNPLLNWIGERKYNGKLRGQDKDKERSFINYCHGQNRPGEIRLIYYQSYQNRAKRNKTKS